MADSVTAIAERLCQADSPHNVQDWTEKDGYYVQTCRVSRDDVPYLIEIARKWSDPDWWGDDWGLDADSDDDVAMLPVTAWRTLADLKSSECVDPLVYMLCSLEDDYDEWISTELPHVFGKIGKPAIEALSRLAKDTASQEFVRSTAAEGLRRVADYHAVARDEVVACLTDMMTNVSRNDVHFNSTLLVGLVELQAVEAAEAIERAFASDCLDVGMMGDWQAVRRKLGVEGLGLEMPKHPHNSIVQLRLKMGCGIFSDRPIFNLDGLQADAEQAYYERAGDLFSKSDEAAEVVERFGNLGWFRLLLEFALHYRSEVVDAMTLASVDQFVFEYMPRKVTCEPSSADSIVFELTMFWEYLNRVYELPAAHSIIEWLEQGHLVTKLESELSAPANFGMAKSMLMAGKKAGYDMTSEKGLAEFMTAYNQSLQSSAASTPTRDVSGRMKIGRNDPCPCGSGKKFKKCCR